MKNYGFILFLACFINFTSVFAQDSKTPQKKAINLNTAPEYKPLAPAKAAFYSAVLPGLGQAYNRSYWKIPIIYAGLGISVYFYVHNNDLYHQYRTAYKRRLAGYSDDQFQGKVSDDGLIEAQKQYQKYKEISIFAAVIIYALNIVDANVEAHLQQFNVSKDLSLRPSYQMNQRTGISNYGLSLNFKF